MRINAERYGRQQLDGRLHGMFKAGRGVYDKTLSLKSLPPATNPLVSVTIHYMACNMFFFNNPRVATYYEA